MIDFALLAHITMKVKGLQLAEQQVGNKISLVPNS